ncbi:dynein light chain Tctex-type protein 2B-like [Mytilus edulis]|uniref:Uncharacterized protein n=1 Tax=Mytilus edulis TaxID=6550 RepID=A0A8S3T6A0_MYTED|nr:unnamed protein product [Mytilus edulis]
MSNHKVLDNIMDTVLERRGSKSVAKSDWKKSTGKNSRARGTGSKLSIHAQTRERSMSSDLDSMDMLRSIKRGVKYENTFRLEPKDDELFSCSKMEKAMQEIMEEVIGDAPYDSVTCNTLVHTVSNQIKDRAKIFPWKRYRFIVHVILGQNTNTSIKVGSRCIWDEHRDTFATASYENKTIFAMATCFAVYLD